MHLACCWFSSKILLRAFWRIEFWWFSCRCSVAELLMSGLRLQIELSGSIRRPWWKKPPIFERVFKFMVLEAQNHLFNNSNRTVFPLILTCSLELCGLELAFSVFAGPCGLFSNCGFSLLGFECTASFALFADSNQWSKIGVRKHWGPQIPMNP